MEQQQSLRYHLLDELRGLDLISMMLYHGMWDVVFLFGITQKWYIAVSYTHLTLPTKA